MATLFQGSWRITEDVLATQVVLNQAGKSLNNIDGHVSDVFRVNICALQDIQNTLALLISNRSLSSIISVDSCKAEQAQDSAGN